MGGGGGDEAQVLQDDEEPEAVSDHEIDAYEPEGAEKEVASHEPAAQDDVEPVILEPPVSVEEVALDAGAGLKMSRSIALGFAYKSSRPQATASLAPSS